MDEITLKRVCNGWLVIRSGDIGYCYCYKTLKEALEHLEEEAKVLDYEPKGGN